MIQGRNVSSRVISGAGTDNVRANVTGGALPRNAQLVLSRTNGRGAVQVVQQPSAANGFTAIIRVSDPRAGAAQYDVEARW